ncbi:hypothetical protein ABPG74_006289 [Tetrahymena malaccensis]
MTKESSKEFYKQILVQQSIQSSIRYYLRNAYLEFKRRLCYFCLAFFSVTIVVAAAGVAQSVIDRAPIIFLSAAESNNGQSDFEIRPSSQILNPGPLAQQSFLNFTRVNEILKDERAEQTSPRFVMNGNLVADSSQILCYIDNSSLQTIYETAQDCKMQKKGILHFIDQQKEKKIGLGTSWEIKEMKEGEITIHKNLQIQMGLEIGQTIYFKTNDFQQIIYNLVEQMCSPKFESIYCQNLKNEIKGQQKDQKIEQTFIVVPFKVAHIFSSEGGKFGSETLDNFLIADFKYLLSYIPKYAAPKRVFMQTQGKQFYDFVLQQKPEFYTTMIKMNLKDRDSVYIDSNYDNIQYTITKFASNVVYDLGVYPIDMYWPVLDELYGTRFAGMFLGIVLNLIIFVLFILSVMLLYNLLLVSVETKTYELGVLRVLGLNKIGVIQLIIIQSLSFVLPAVIFGFFLTIPLLMIVSDQLESAVGALISIYPTKNAIIFGLCLGVLIPLVSSIIPIKQALQQTLSIAIDQQRSKSQAVKIEIDVEGKSFPWGVISFALISSMFGVSIYYLLPLALLSFDFALLINIFFWILIGLLVGCILLALNVQYLIERFVVNLCFFWVKSAIKTIVIKNLATHRLKNRRTAIIYGLSIAFVIFVWTAMTVQIESADFVTRQSRGAYMTVQNTNSNYLSVPTFEKIIKEKLNNCVISHSWQTVNLNRYLNEKGYHRTFLTHFGKVYEVYPYVVGISPNFLDTTFREEFEETVLSSGTDLDVVRELYTPRGSQSMILGQTYQKVFYNSIDHENPLLNIAYNHTGSLAFLTRVSAISKQMPGLTYSGLPSVNRQNIAISLPQYMNIIGDLIDSSDDIPMQKLLFKFHDSCRQQLYDTLTQEINMQRLEATVWDYNDTLSTTLQQKKLINIIFTVICVIVMILSFFSLVSSMTANILEQTKEIAVLRAVGITTFRMKTIYFFEAFTLVFSSCIIGTVVGVAIGFTMSIQRALFTDLPIQFVFPYMMLAVMSVASLICAFFSTILPTTKILKSQIAQIIRIAY